MTDENLQKANELKSEIDRLKECVWFFSPAKQYVSKYDKEQVEKAKKMRFPYIFEGFMKDGKKKARLNYHGFFGGSTIEVDDEFVSMCNEYFTKKLEEKKREFEELN